MQGMKLRVKFSKHGALKFIGHLDVMRFFQKAIRRAGIDIAYSAGFSPHQIMTFAAPLGVGLESNGEYMDIEVNSLTSAAEFMEALNAQMAEGIQILNVCLLPEHAGNAMASVAAAKYAIAFREGYKPSFLTNDVVYNSLLSQKEISVTKKTKRGESTFNLRPYIYECSYNDETGMLNMLVDASSSGNVKPSLVVKTLYELNGADFDEFGLLITREETYTKLSDNTFAPLDCIGSVF